VHERPIGVLVGDAIVRLRVAGSELPRLDAELLLGHVTGLDRAAIVAHPEQRIAPAAVGAIEAAVARRERGEPVAYIRGTKEFRGLGFRVDGRALIPRPETERLVELGIGAVEAALARLGREAPVRVADVGTGSGAVAVALAAGLRTRGLLDRAEVVATERSRSAAALARENVALHCLDHDVRVVEGDLIPPGEGTFDVVLANLPYIPSAEIAGLPIAASFEPREALDGGPDGLGIIRRLVARLPDALRPDGIAALEIGDTQRALLAAAVKALVPGCRVQIEPDLSGLPRIALIEVGPALLVKHRERERSGMAGAERTVGTRQ
jgi:release factor glutamine methyltransferase